MQRKLKFVVAAALLAATCVVSACGSSGEEDAPAEAPANPPPDPIPNTAPLPPPTSLVCPKGTTLTYENFGEAFMLNYCTMCHSKNLADGQRGGAPIGVDFDGPDEVAIWRGSIIATTLGTTAADGKTTTTATMPPSGQVAAGELSLFADWLNCGTPGSTQRIK